MSNPNNEQSQGQGQTQAPPTPASPSEAATTAALASASAPVTNSTVVGTKRKPPAHKSTVWDHFDKLPVDENNPEARAKCRVKTIGKAIEKCLLGWGIENVFSITVDNASSKDTAVTYLKKHFRNWNRDLHYSIGAIRNVVRYVRWNSTYFMLEHAMKIEKVFEWMEDDDEGYTSHFTEDPNRAGPPCYCDWRNASVFVQFLRVFYSITVRLSGSLYVTSNSCFHDIAHVQTMLKASIAHRDALIGGMANNMKIKYDKYWEKPENFNPLIVIGVVLDPRYKLDYVNSTFEDIYDDLQEFEHTQESGESNTTPDADGLPVPDFVNTNPKGKWWSKKKNNATDQKSDLEKYLADEIHDIDNNFDILAWWKENANKYKILSLIARDVLDVPVSTVASESAFSTGGHVLDVFRSSLSLKMTEALICTQNWLSPTEFNFNDRDFDQYEETDSIASDVLGESTVTVDTMNID
ncbi:zinc finger BED domain-containing protein RICESLEEPER 2-like [Senna tora]|uniref:Zinc finger BED domain-containing protein RICESLEEPER 2-like n=1 Tax=Senna tora TaxID=362788 RepID=A0A834VY80_9FABA|nr:zinc finger BED domain-containing protein RICESLEEPER 2-like [Senna tora]